MEYGHARARDFAFHATDGTHAFTFRARTVAEALRRRLATGEGLSGIDLRGRNLRGLDLEGVDLTGADLRDADMRGCAVSFARFDRADLSGADLAGVVGSGTSFRGATLGLNGGKATGLDGCELLNASFADATLTGTGFANAVLERTDFSGAVALAAVFRGARMGDTDHGRADYRDCDFTRADFRALSGRARPGVTRVDRTAGARAVSNTFDEARLDGTMPAFVWDRRLSAVSKALAVGLAGGAVAGALVLAGHGAGAAGHALSAVVDTAALAERLEAMVHYRHLADLLSGTAPARWAGEHSAALVAAVVSGALLLKDKVADKAKDFLSGKVRKLVDAVRPAVADVARRVGSVNSVVAAFMAHPSLARTLHHALSRTGAGPDGAPSPVRQAGFGGTRVLVCTADNLNRAMEWLATSVGPLARPAQDVLLVRDRAAGTAPVSVRLHAGGGMTASWTGPDGIRTRAWEAVDFHPDPTSPWVRSLPQDGPDVVLAAFENAILRDHLPGLDVPYARGRARVEFDDGGMVRVIGSVVDGGARTYSGRLTDDDVLGMPGPGL